jgi:hypothetical protein
MGFLDSLFGIKDAKNAVSNAATQNRAVADNAWSDAQGILAPYTGQGAQAFTKLSDFLGVNGIGAQRGAYDGYVEGPDVAARRAAGIGAIDNSYAARTAGTDSGALRKAQMKFGTDLATQDYGNYLSRLLSTSALGQSGANTLTGARMNAAGLTTNANTAEGTGLANASLASGNILQNLITGGMNLMGTGWNPFGGNSGGSFNQQQGQMTGNRFW